MASLTTTERLQETLSLALEDRASGYQDLVSNANALLTVMKDKGQFQSFSGPNIRERLLYNESGTYTRYQGYDFLNPQPVELINDAIFDPKLAAVSVTLSNEDILKNSGKAQLLGLMKVHIEGAEQELQDRFVEDLHSAGTADGGLQIGGLQAAIPTDPTSGTYGGISRADNAIWRTSEYDVTADFATSSISAWTSSTCMEILDNVFAERTRGNKGPDIVLLDKNYYVQFAKATQAIQRINDENKLGKLGFAAMKYYGNGRSVDVVLEGGIGTAMPSNTGYIMDTSSIKFRFHPDRNFSKIGSAMMPINQDAVVQHSGFMGNLTLCNPLHNAKLHQ